MHEQKRPLNFMENNYAKLDGVVLYGDIHPINQSVNRHLHAIAVCVNSLV